MKRISIEAWIEDMRQSEENSMLEHVESLLNDFLEYSKKSIISCINSQLGITRKWSDWEWYTIKSFFDGNSGVLLSVSNGYWISEDEIDLTGSFGEFELEVPWRMTPAREAILNRWTDGFFQGQYCYLSAEYRYISLSVDADSIIDYLIESLP